MGVGRLGLEVGCPFSHSQCFRHLESGVGAPHLSQQFGNEQSGF